MGLVAGEGAAALGRSARRAAEQAEHRGRKVPQHIARITRDVERAQGHSASASAKGRLVWPYVAGGGAAAGAAGLLIAHRSRKKDTVGKSLIAVPVSKATHSQDGTNVLRLTARTPSGRFVSHANDLRVVHITPRRNPTSRLMVYGKSASSVSRMMQTGFRTPKRVSAVPKPASEDRFVAARMKGSKAGSTGRSVGRRLAG